MKYLFFFFTCFTFGQDLVLDSISYNYFYKDVLEDIVRLKKKENKIYYRAINQLYIAELYQNINCEDSAYAIYYKVFEQENKKLTLSNDQYNNLLFQLHAVESSKHNYKKDRRYFLSLLKERTKNSASNKWFAKIENEHFKDLYEDTTKLKLALNKIKSIQNTQYYNSNDTFKATILLNLGNVYTSLNKFEEAEENLFKALKLSKKNNNYLNQVYCLINLGANENKRENYKKALDYFNKVYNIPNKDYKIKIERILADNRYWSYYNLKDSLNYKYQDALYLKLDSVINDFKRNSNFYEIDVAYQTKEKDKKIEELSSFKKSFNKNRIVYSVLLFCVFLLALYSFIRWKRVDKKKQLLNKEKQLLKTEKEITEQELEKVKSLIIKDYIVLKNKSKVYLTELIYVKSDGHYLNLFTTAKKEFVRGKISEIEKQLPPNFVKCHRSYIVNENFIKQYSSTEVFMENGDTIPLSRGFKF